MNKNNIFYTFIFLLFIVIFSSCSNTPEQIEETIEVPSKSQLVYNEIIKNGDFLAINEFPPLIKASDLYQNMNEHNLIIDIRKGLDYSKGHIKGAVNLKLSELIDFAQVNGFPEYEKIIIACYTGQSASFGAAVLRMLGYQNVYVLEWGMCSWNKRFSSKWENNTADKFESKVVTKVSPKKDNSLLPEIETDRNSGTEILYNRAKQILADGYGKCAVTIDRAVPNLNKSFEICMIPEDLYKTGHLKGSVLYKAENLKTTGDLLSIPNDKVIVVYSLNGHQSAFITAYLKVLGYDAKNLKYGASSFMYNTLVDKSFNSFSTKHINNFPTETSEYIEEDGEVEEGGC